MCQEWPLIAASLERDGSKTLGQFIRHLRGRAGWSQAVLADQAGVSRNHVGVIERGDLASPRLSVLCQLAQALDVSAGTLALAFLHPLGSHVPVVAIEARPTHRDRPPARSGQVYDVARLGIIVQALRGRSRISQQQLAASAGLNRSTLQKLERGMTSDPELMTLVRIANALARAARDPAAVALTTAQLVCVFAEEPGAPAQYHL